MKSFIPLVLIVAQAVLLQNTFAHVIRAVPSGCGCVPNLIAAAPSIIAAPSVIAAPTVVTAPPVIAAPSVLAGPSVIVSTNPSVADSLADTLSLLTVSSLLSETLPLGYNVVGVPVGGCGCGYGGYSYIL